MKDEKKRKISNFNFFENMFDLKLNLNLIQKTPFQMFSSNPNPYSNSLSEKKFSIIFENFQNLKNERNFFGDLFGNDENERNSFEKEEKIKIKESEIFIIEKNTKYKKNNKFNIKKTINLTLKKKIKFLHEKKK